MTPNGAQMAEGHVDMSGWRARANMVRFWFRAVCNLKCRELLAFQYGTQSYTANPGSCATAIFLYSAIQNMILNADQAPPLPDGMPE